MNCSGFDLLKKWCVSRTLRLASVRDSGSQSPTPDYLAPTLRRGDAQPFFFLFLDNDAGGHHHHQALRFAANADVFEQSVDVGELAEDRHAELVAPFAEAFDAAEQHRSAVWHADRGRYGYERERWQLH